MSGNYFMQFIGDDFQKYVIDKFVNLVPQELENVITRQLVAEAVAKLGIASIIPRCNRDGILDRRYNTANLAEAGIIPAATDPNTSFEELNLRSINNPEELNLTQPYFITLQRNYHEDQSDLFKILNINFNDDNWMTIYDENNDRLATCWELASAIDNLSIDQMRLYKPANPNTSFSEADAHNEATRKIIELCRKVIVGRACVHSCSKNDMMTKRGWKIWQRHAMILGSLTVYYIMLQMRRFSICGTYYFPEG